jgi:hypothetical protein
MIWTLLFACWGTRYCKTIAAQELLFPANCTCERIVTQSIGDLLAGRRIIGLQNRQGEIPSRDPYPLVFVIPV